MTNFDFLKKDPRFESFADAAIAAENILHIDAEASVLNCRRAMELAVRWMYSVDRGLPAPYQDTLSAMMNEKKFKELVGKDIWKRMDFIRKVGNIAAHSEKKVTLQQAELCIENLYYFLDEAAYYYSDEYTQRCFDRSLLALTAQEALSFAQDGPGDLESIIRENEQLKAELTARRAQQQQTYVPAPIEASDFEARRIYTDFMLQDAGWTEGIDLLSDRPIPGCSLAADRMLCGEGGKPLAVLETKHSASDFSLGRKAALSWADALEREYGRRPVIFLSSGFETRILDGVYPERRVASVYSKRDLERLFELRSRRDPLRIISVDKSIAGRYYHEKAVRAVCRGFDREKRRRALLVMAAGSGKTRTVMALCDVLRRSGWIRNILFLTDRDSLATQAMRGFAKLLPDLSATKLAASGFDPSAACVFSTYEAIAEYIDSARDDRGKVFTCGHFDLVVCDEAHRTVYERYRDVFSFFDAPMVGLTSTPAGDIDKMIYDLFELEKGSPTFVYDQAQALRDGYLIDFVSVESDLNYIENGAGCDELSEAERAACEDAFGETETRLPEGIVSPALNRWINREETIRQALRILMDNGLKVDRGTLLGKTIIFARDHAHAVKILEVFNKEYPSLPLFAQVIDSRTPSAQDVLDSFSDEDKLPRIAVSADMLETGIDVPEVLNLAFFKRVMSKSMFRQMIGRGSRLCSSLVDGQDKEKFYVFDFCGNFEFFRMSGEHVESGARALPGYIMRLQAQIALRLQDSSCRTYELTAFRKSLALELAQKVSELNRNNYAVRQHLEYVERFSDPDSYHSLTFADTLIAAREIAPLLSAGDSSPDELRFDAMMYGAELSVLEGRASAHFGDIQKTALALLEAEDAAQLAPHAPMLEELTHASYFRGLDVMALENVRRELRGLLRRLSSPLPLYDSDPGEDLRLAEGEPPRLKS